MPDLTKLEKSRIKKVEKLLLNPPSDRLGLFTIGDYSLSVYDQSEEYATVYPLP